MPREAGSSPKWRAAGPPAIGAVVGGIVATLVLSASAHATNFPVSNNDDAGNGSLRAAIEAANAAPNPPHLIDATDVTGTIALQAPLPNLTGNFEIRGPGASTLTVRRANIMGLFRVFTVDASAQITLSGLTIANGLTPDTVGMNRGGGILTSGKLTMLRTAVSGNSGQAGGGIYNTGGELAVRSSTVSGNTARETSAGGRGGAGIHNDGNGTATVANTTVSGNTTAGRGGGIYNDSASGGTSSVTIANSTVADNAGAGANLFNESEGPISFRSTIVSDPVGTPENCGGAGGGSSRIMSQGYNLASDASCNLTATADQPNTNPMLGSLAANGGPTRTMALLPSSPAIDKGIRNGLTADQRGLKRPVVFPQIPSAPGGDGTDIGAFEVQTLPPPPPPPPNGPSNDFTFGKVKKNKKRGTAKLTVNVPGPGDLELARTKKVKGAEKRAASEGSVKLKLKPMGKAKKKLADKGRAKVKAGVTFIPDGGDPNTKSKRVKLARRP
jgi:hypothetical protein